MYELEIEKFKEDLSNAQELVRFLLPVLDIDLNFNNNDLIRLISINPYLKFEKILKIDRIPERNENLKQLMLNNISDGLETFTLNHSK